MRRSLATKTVSKPRERLGTFLVVCLAIFALISAVNYLNAVKYLERTFQTRSWFNQSFYRYNDKLSCLESELLPNQTVGFVGKLSDPQNIEYYQLTQFFLVPTLVDYSAAQPFVIVYTPNSDELESTLTSHPNLKIVKDCQNGIFLLECKP